MARHGRRTGPEKRRRKFDEKLLYRAIAQNVRPVEVRQITPEDLERLEEKRRQKPR